jgi:ABC-2 type transport system ATP-binding protein
MTQAPPRIEPVARDRNAENLCYSIDALTKIYGGTVLANDNISLEIRQGEVFGLLGPNGAGKSTLVQQMVGLLRPDRGQIIYQGKPIEPGNQLLKRRVAYLSQRPLALLDLKVREAIAYTGQLRGLEGVRARKEASHLIAELGLEECADRIIAKLSGGQLRLTALGSALIGEGSTLVLDEPTNELDPEMRRRVWRLLRERCGSRGTTIVLVTHNALEAEQAIDRVAVLMSGKIVACGTPGQIKTTIDRRVRLELTFREGADYKIASLKMVSDPVRETAGRFVLSVPRTEVRGAIDQVLALVSLDDLDDFRVLTPTLEDVYLQVAARQRQDS